MTAAPRGKRAASPPSHKPAPAPQPARPGRTARRKRRNALLLGGLGGLLGLGLLALALVDAAPHALSAPARSADQIVSVHVPSAEQDRIDSWAEFFVCYNLVRDESVIIATLRENGFGADAAWRPDRDVRLVLRAGDPGEYSRAENALLDQVRALSVAERRGGGAACSR